MAQLCQPKNTNFNLKLQIQSEIYNVNLAEKKCKANLIMELITQMEIVGWKKKYCESFLVEQQQ